MRVDGQSHTSAALAPVNRPGTHCTVHWVGPRAAVGVRGNSRPSPEFDTRTVKPVASRYT
jgi:hypothetical protein